jgi:hypothetical protein
MNLISGSPAGQNFIPTCLDDGGLTNKCVRNCRNEVLPNVRFAVRIRDPRFTSVALLTELSYDREGTMIEDRIKQVKMQQQIVLLKGREEHLYFRDELESLDSQTDANRKNIWRNVEGYAKRSCRILCQKIQDALPPELRHMIYSYLHDTTTVAVNDWPSFRDKRSLAVPTPYFTRYPGSRHDGLACAHYWNTEYVGEEVVRELAKKFYANTCFDFRTNFHLIPRVLKEDRWNLGLIPGSRICHVKMDLLDRWFLPKLLPEDTKSADNLLLFKPSTRFVLYINDMYNSFLQEEEDIESYICRFEVLFPFVRRLEKAGYRLTFRVLKSYLNERSEPTELISDSIEDLANAHFKVSLQRLRVLMNHFANRWIFSER